MLTHPFTATIAGPTGCGKTQFVFRLIENATEMIDPPPKDVVYCYGEYQPIFRRYPSVTFCEGLPEPSSFDGVEPTLLVIDDLMQETDARVANIFTKVSHHRNVSVIYLTQNIFDKNKFARTISLNSHYLVLFKNPRDAGQFANLARQMYPNGSKFAVESFRDATDPPFGYLFVDLKPEQGEQFRLRTGIFPGDTHYVYVRK